LLLTLDGLHDECREKSNAEDNYLARKISRLRSKLGPNQEQFAAKVGVTFSTVKRWGSGKSKPSPLAMRQIEELMERSEGEE